MTMLLLPQASQYLGPLILVNASHPLKEELISNILYPVDNAVPPILLQSSAAQAYRCLINKFAQQNKLQPISGYRSQQEQQTIYQQASVEHGEQFAATYVAKPGCSEHQSGLALDMALTEEPINYLTPDFPYHGMAQQFRELAPYFGFIERYPKGKESITNIGHEPWHFRYVGLPHSLVISKYQLVLEEYLQMLKDYPQGKNPLLFHHQQQYYAISYQPAQGETTPICLLEDAPYTISGNNSDGFIITVWSRY